MSVSTALLRSSRAPVASPGWRRPQHAMRPMLAGPSSSSAPFRRTHVGRYMGEDAELLGLEDGFCYFASVEALYDTSSVVVECQDYSGLLRVISWVLNGLQVRVAQAECKTDAEGLALDTFKLTDLAGAPLDAVRLELVVDTLMDTLQQCAPSMSDANAEELFAHNIYINNKQEGDLTEVVLYGADKPGFLLEVASVLTGVGVSIKQAFVNTCTEYPPPDRMDYECKTDARMFRFLVDDGHGSKLSVAGARSLMYVLNLFMGKGKAPTIAPGVDFKTYTH